MNLDALPRDPRGAVHPCDVIEVAALVREAARQGRQVRVRGSGHSIPAAIVTDTFLSGRGRGVDVVLDRLRDVWIDARASRVVVGAGVRFGADPYDPHADEGLCPQLDRAGFALPNLGGIVHQTVVGFLLTGSAGGSLRHDLHAAVEAITFVDGHGDIRTVTRTHEAEVFAALGVSMGLLGVVVSVTLRVEPRFDVVGEERILARPDLPFDPAADGQAGLVGWLDTHDYARVLWWPQAGVDRWVLWHVDRAPPGVAVAPVAYAPFPRVAGSTVPVQTAATAALLAIGRAQLSPAWVAPLYRAFVPAAPEQVQRFSGSWHDVLPVDREMVEGLMTTTFTELWVPVSRAGAALRALQARFATDPSAAGRFTIELYASPAGEFWLSPGVGEASLRFNVFWLEHDPGDPRDTLFPAMWEVLEPFGARYHWGKLLPRDLAATGRRLAPRFPRWADFLRERAACDPDGVFLTGAWRTLLGLPGGLASPPSPLPHRRAIVRPTLPAVRWPLPFRCAPADVGLFDEVGLIYRSEGVVPGPPERAVGLLTSDASVGFTPGLRHWLWLTPRGVVDGAVVEEHFLHLGMRWRTVTSTPTCWLAYIERLSMPLGTRMVIEVSAVPEGDDARVHIRVAVDVPSALRPAVPLVRPLFQRQFDGMITALRRHLTAGDTRA